MGNRQELVIYGKKPSAAGQAGPGSTDSGPQGHTSPLGLITEDILYLYRKSQMLFVGNSELELAL